MATFSTLSQVSPAVTGRASEPDMAAGNQTGESRQGSSWIGNQTVTAGQDIAGSMSLEGNVSTRKKLPAPVTGMKKWEGRITEIVDELFSAELSPLDHAGSTILADFDLSLLAPDDVVAHVGDVVYLTVRTVNTQGHPTVTSGLRLRKLARLPEQDLDNLWEEAQREARELQQYAD